MPSSFFVSAFRFLGRGAPLSAWLRPRGGLAGYLSVWPFTSVWRCTYVYLAARVGLTPCVRDRFVVYAWICAFAWLATCVFVTAKLCLRVRLHLCVAAYLCLPEWLLLLRGDLPLSLWRRTSASVAAYPLSAWRRTFVNMAARVGLTLCASQHISVCVATYLRLMAANLWLLGGVPVPA